MKLLSHLSRITLLASAAFLLGLAFDVQALTLLGVSITASLLLVASGDYASSGARLARWHAHAQRIPATRQRRRYTLPFAA